MTNRFPMGNIVDLGLSVLWADSNLGASRPEVPGDYFAWGETMPKTAFTRNNYRFIPAGEVDFNIDDDDYEYRYFSKYQDDDALSRLEPVDDAAAANLGGGWRIPGRKEWQELADNCDWSWDPARNGFLITSRFNGNSIFLPFTGMHYFDGLEFGDAFEGLESFGLYWTAELSGNAVCDAKAFYLTDRKRTFKDIARESGVVVRAIFCELETSIKQSRNQR